MEHDLNLNTPICHPGRETKNAIFALKHFEVIPNAESVLRHERVHGAKRILIDI